MTTTSDRGLVSKPVAVPMLPWLFRQSLALTWGELGRLIVIGAVTAATVLPLVAAVLVGSWWLIAPAALPPCLAGAGLAQVAGRVVAGGPATRKDLLRADPVLGTSFAVASVAAAALIGRGGGLAVAGEIAAGLLLLIAPSVLAYGAVRGRTGLAAWRGGLLLVAYRPSWALTVLGTGVLGGFAIAATAGVLVVVVPALVLIFATAVVATLLAEIDDRQEGRS